MRPSDFKGLTSSKIFMDLLQFMIGLHPSKPTACSKYHVKNSFNTPNLLNIIA